MEAFIVENPQLFVTIVLLLAAWSVIWKGFALWRAARLRQKIWFVVLLVVNTVGILEIIYLFVVTKPEANTKPSETSE